MGVATRARAQQNFSLKYLAQWLSPLCHEWALYFCRIPYTASLTEFRRPSLSRASLLPEAAVNFSCPGNLTHRFSRLFLWLIVNWRWRYWRILFTSLQLGRWCFPPLGSTILLRDPVCLMDIWSRTAGEMCCQMHALLHLIILLIYIGVCPGCSLI